MNAKQPRQHELERLIAYAEGELSPEERLSVEATLTDRPDLARALEQLDADAQALRAHFTVPKATPRYWTPLRIGALAAGIVLVVTMSTYLLYTPVPTVQLAHARGVLEGAFEPEIVCDTPEKFRQYGLDVFGVALTADFGAAAAEQVALIGWTAYEGRYGQEVDVGEKPVRALLARAPGGERVVVVFRPRNTLRFQTENTRGYSKHSTTIGGLIVDEISTLTEPVVLPLLGAEGQ